jgi:hypothetical protein
LRSSSEGLFQEKWTCSVIERKGLGRRMIGKRVLKTGKHGGGLVELGKVGEVHTRLVKEVEGLEIIKKMVVHKV